MRWKKIETGQQSDAEVWFKGSGNWHVNEWNWKSSVPQNDSYITSPNVICSTSHGALAKKNYLTATTTGPFWFSMCSPGSKITLGTEVFSSGFCKPTEKTRHQVINWAGWFRSVVFSFGCGHSVRFGQHHTLSKNTFIPSSKKRSFVRRGCRNQLGKLNG